MCQMKVETWREHAGLFAQKEAGKWESALLASWQQRPHAILLQEGVCPESTLGVGVNLPPRPTGPPSPKCHAGAQASRPSRPHVHKVSLSFTDKNHQGAGREYFSTRG